MTVLWLIDRNFTEGLQYGHCLMQCAGSRAKQQQAAGSYTYAKQELLSAVVAGTPGCYRTCMLLHGNALIVLLLAAYQAL